MISIRDCIGFLDSDNDEIRFGPFSCLMFKAGHRLETREQVFSVYNVKNLGRLIKTTVIDPVQYLIYESVVHGLSQKFGVFFERPGQKDLVDVFSWVVLSGDLHPLLIDEEPEALVILSYFCILLNKLSYQ